MSTYFEPSRERAQPLVWPVILSAAGENRIGPILEVTSNGERGNLLYFDASVKINMSAYVLLYLLQVEGIIFILYKIKVFLAGTSNLIKEKQNNYDILQFYLNDC